MVRKKEFPAEFTYIAVYFGNTIELVLHIIVLITLFTWTDDAALPFLPFSSNRQQLEHYLDGVSDRIYISNGFPFGQQTHTIAYVSR